MRVNAVIFVLILLPVIAYACLPDTHSAAVVLNNGEYSDFKKIEMLGEPGKQYIKEVQNSSGAEQLQAWSNINSQNSPLKKESKVAPLLFATLLSASFEYDPDADSSFIPKQSFVFSGDTLIIHDYWALVEQPELSCSLSVSNDTLSISYVFEAGLVKDWMPSVETTLKIRFGGICRTIVCCFNEFKNHARTPRAGEAGFRDANVKRYVAVPVPPLVTYKYRAHSNPNAMVYLSYLQYDVDRWVAPEVSVSFNDSADDQETDVTLAELLSKELQWLKEKSICSASESTISFLKEMKNVGGGWSYWSKQDSIIALNQWFTIYNHGLHVNGTRGGCGLGTDFELPTDKIISNVLTKPVLSGNVRNSIISHLQNGVLTVNSSTNVISRVSVYDITGRRVSMVECRTPSGNVAVPFQKSGYSHGSYLVEVRFTDKKVIYFKVLSGKITSGVGGTI